MSELSPLISDLALILVVAGIFSLLFKWLKQPLVLAYIAAGIVISFFITREDPQYENIRTWADVGIIFLLFGLGLEFSFKRLMKVGATAFIATMFIVISMMTVGYVTGISFGWSHMASIFLGAMLCMSSTMIIIKVFDELNLTNKNFTGIVLGILIIEDLVAVLLMVLLSTLAISQNFEGSEMIFSLFKLIAFLAFWFFLGTYLIPTFLRKTRRFLNDEILLVISLAFCLGMAYLATKSGFSSALGAFIMGSIFAETIDSEKIDKMILPIKNFFGAIFFVSVGMLIQVATLGQYIVPILILSLIVILGQIVFATSGVLLAGQNLKTAVFSGFSLTQIGEFSYIIGALGLTLGVIEPSLYQIIVSVSVITIFVTPYMIKLATPTYIFLERKLPTNWQKYLNRDSSGAHPVNNNSLWKKLFQGMFSSVLIYYFICIVIVFFSFRYAVPKIQEWLPDIKGNIVSAIIIIGLISPFLRAIIIRNDDSAEFINLWKKNKVNRGPLVLTIVIRLLLCAGLIMYVLIQLFHTSLAVAFTLAIILLFIFMASKRLKQRMIHIESRFKTNLNEKDDYEESKAPLTQGFVNRVLAQDLHLSEFSVLHHYSIVGKTLKELKFRQNFGVNIVTILRGNSRINIPNGEERIYPGDRLIVLGTDRQMKVFENKLEEKKEKVKNKEEYTAELQINQVQIEADSSLIDKTIESSCIQENYDCLLVGIERNNHSILNPDLDLKFESGDILWLIGEEKNILKIKDL